MSARCSENRGCASADDWSIETRVRHYTLQNRQLLKADSTLPDGPSRKLHLAAYTLNELGGPLRYSIIDGTHSSVEVAMVNLLAE